MRYRGRRDVTAGRRSRRKLPGVGMLTPGGCQFFQMDATDDQNRIDSGGVGPRDFGAEAVADGGDPPTVMDTEQVEAAPVDRGVRLGVIADRTAQFLVAL